MATLKERLQEARLAQNEENQAEQDRKAAITAEREGVERQAPTNV